MFGVQSDEKPTEPVSFRQRLQNIRNCTDFVGKDVLRYWELKSGTDPEMDAVAEIVLALPISQVSVERAFSHLPLILTDRRTRESDKTLDNNLTVKLNFDKYL